jgi:hypothetical protein
MKSSPGRRDADDMNMNLTSPSQHPITSRHDIRALLAVPVIAVPVIGVAATAASGIAALAVAGVAGALFAGDSASPASVWAGTHYADAYLTSHPMLLAACCALIAAAAALAATSRRGLAALLLCAAAVTPWVPAMAFLHHLWQLAPAG